VSEPAGTGRPDYREAALLLSAGLRDQIARHAETAYPGEACGALLGSPDMSDLPTVTRAIPLRNSEPRAGDGYRIELNELQKLHPGGDSQQEQLMGFYHSHPDRSARPSERDLRIGVPGLLYVTISVRSGRAGARIAWIVSPAVPATADSPSREGVCRN